ncbi:hypothetical protein L5220_04360 [Synechococcus sp. PCC 6716]|nr:hypothetical protein [Synechococcus sp. PCC 6716]
MREKAGQGAHSKAYDFVGIAECGYELPSFPTLLAKEKGAKSLVPSPLGEGGKRLKPENHTSIQQCRFVNFNNFRERLLARVLNLVKKDRKK